MVTLVMNREAMAAYRGNAMTSRFSSWWRRGVPAAFAALLAAPAAGQTPDSDGRLPLTRAPGYDMYEYACHEGNQDVAIYLGGGRAEEAGR